MRELMSGPVSRLTAAAVLLCLAGQVGAEATAGWYLGLEGGTNRLEDAENRSTPPDDFDPGEQESCGIEVPSILCLLPSSGSAGSFQPGQTQISDSTYEDGLHLGLRIGFAYNSGARPELSLSYRENEFESVTLREGFGEENNGSVITELDGQIRALGLMGNFWYDLNTNSFITPYLGAGVGARYIELAGGAGNAEDSGDDSDTVFGYQLGAGLNVWLGELFSVSLDYRWLAGDNPEFKTAERVPLTSEYQAQSLSLGLRYVFDPQDPRDADGDGVPDRRDRCPNTPQGAPVDVHGCPLDSDGDGVPDYRDKCPNTPPGTTVDENGCALDSDGDGVPDSRDQCPGTPKGVAVDADGCPLDSDGDGVPDYLDQCPDTPPNTPVMTNGCGVGQSQVLHGVSFQFNSARLDPNSKALLKLTAEVLRASPAFTLEVQGHTCDLGPDAYNLKLSQQRAESVRNFLINEGVEADSLLAQGYGETEPLTDNSDEEQREINRRVVLKVLSR